MKNHATRVVVGSLLIAMGTLLALLPKEWIESTIGFEPDGGSGLLELALALAPIATPIGVMLIASVAVEARHARDRIAALGSQQT